MNDFIKLIESKGYAMINRTVVLNAYIEYNNLEYFSRGYIKGMTFVFKQLDNASGFSEAISEQDELEEVTYYKDLKAFKIRS